MIPQIPKMHAMIVTGMKMRGAFFFGLYSSPSNGLSNNDIVQSTHAVPNSGTWTPIVVWVDWVAVVWHQ
jgi:hypothetical protein